MALAGKKKKDGLSPPPPREGLLETLWVCVDSNPYYQIMWSSMCEHTCKYRILTEFGPPMWQAEADTEMTLSASPAMALGQILLTMAKFC